MRLPEASNLHKSNLHKSNSNYNSYTDENETSYMSNRKRMLL